MDQRTIDIYNDQAERYASITESEFPDDNLLRFVEALPPRGAVLDLGCGPGMAAAFMTEKGFAVKALDASTAMAALAKEKHGIDVSVAPFESVADQNRFDGIWASFSLLHAPRQSMPGHLNRLKTAIKPGGILAVGLKIGEGEYRDKIGRIYTYYQEDEIKNLLKQAGFSPIETTYGKDAGLSGEISEWMVVTAHG